MANDNTGTVGEDTGPSFADEEPLKAPQNNDQNQSGRTDDSSVTADHLPPQDEPPPGEQPRPDGDAEPDTGHPDHGLTQIEENLLPPSAAVAPVSVNRGEDGEINEVACTVCDIAFPVPEETGELHDHFEKPCHDAAVQAWIGRANGPSEGSSADESTSAPGRVVEAGRTALGAVDPGDEGAVWAYGNLKLDTGGFKSAADDQTFGRTTLLSTPREQITFGIAFVATVAFLASALANFEVGTAVSQLVGATLVSARSIRRVFKAKGVPTKRIEYALAEPFTAALGAVSAVVSVSGLAVATMMTGTPPDQILGQFGEVTNRLIRFLRIAFS